MPAKTRDDPAPVKLISGLLFPAEREDLMEWATGQMSASFGAIELASRLYPFDYTDYYRDIAPRLERRFFVFAGLRRPFGLVAWKKRAISIEAESDEGAGRKVNIDPGYMDGARLVLASTKDNAHRIYLWDGIYAEVTMCRKKSGWIGFSYTFPDFASGAYDDFLDSARNAWKRDLRSRRS
jgi:hypothetical protein